MSPNPQTPTNITAKTALLMAAISLIALSTQGLENGVHPQDIIEFVFAVILIILREYVKNGNE